MSQGETQIKEQSDILRSSSLNGLLLINTHTQSQTNSLSLSLTHTHTHTHTPGRMTSKIDLCPIEDQYPLVFYCHICQLTEASVHTLIYWTLSLSYTHTHTHAQWGCTVRLSSPLSSHYKWLSKSACLCVCVCVCVSEVLTLVSLAVTLIAVHLATSRQSDPFISLQPPRALAPSLQSVCACVCLCVCGCLCACVCVCACLCFVCVFRGQESSQTFLICFDTTELHKWQGYSNKAVVEGAYTHIHTHTHTHTHTYTQRSIKALWHWGHKHIQCVTKRPSGAYKDYVQGRKGVLLLDEIQIAFSFCSILLFINDSSWLIHVRKSRVCKQSMACRLGRAAALNHITAGRGERTEKEKEKGSERERERERE